MASEKENFRKDGRTGKSSKRGKGPRDKNKKFNKKEDRFDKEANGGKTKASNDPGWYGADTAVMRDAANLPFAQSAGLPINVFNSHQNLLEDTSYAKFVFPGIMRFGSITLPGTIGDWSDPVNVCIRDKYSFIRHANSGHANYNASDLGMYFMAYDSCATFYAFMCRIYGLLRTSILRNRYTPDDLVAAAGGAYTDLIKHMAEFRAYINTFASRLILKVPSDLTFIERHMWLYSNVFADAPTDKAQLYIISPDFLWKHRVTDTNHGMQANLVEDMDFQAIVEFGESLLNDILNDEDFNIMSGDIIKAYGEKTFSLKLIPDDFTIAPVFDPEFLLQIHNATIITPELSEDWNINEVMDEDSYFTGALTSADTFRLREPADAKSWFNIGAMVDKILDMPITNPTPREVAIATRMMVSAHVHNNMLQLKDYGTEAITSMRVYYHDAEVGAPRVVTVNPVDPPSIESFGSHPLFMRITPIEGAERITNSASIESFDVYGDVDNYVVLHNDTLSNIHRMATMAMYGLVR